MCTGSETASFTSTTTQPSNQPVKATPPDGALLQRESDDWGGTE